MVGIAARARPCAPGQNAAMPVVPVKQGGVQIRRIGSESHVRHCSARRRRGLGRLRPFAHYADALARRAAKSRGGALVSLQLDWPAAAGAEIAAWSHPLALRLGRTGRPGDLTLAVDSGRALEAQHLAPTLIARLNAYLGRRVIGRLHLKQTSGLARGNATAAAAAPSATAAVPPEMEDLLDAVEDPDLRDALRRLGAQLAKP